MPEEKDGEFMVFGNYRSERNAYKRYGFDPWVGKIPTSTFLSGKSHGQRSLTGYSPWGFERVGQDLMTKTTTKHKDLVNVFADLFKNVPCSQRNQMPT